MTTKVIESDFAKPNLEGMRVGCAREGCSNCYEGRQPTGWVNLLVYSSTWPQYDRTLGEISESPCCQRDTVLCPEHALELECMLIDIGNKLKNTVGNA
jgi:hypothetical protein